MKIQLLNFKYHFDGEVAKTSTSCKLDMLDDLKKHVELVKNTIFLIPVHKLDEDMVTELFVSYNRDFLDIKKPLVLSWVFYAPTAILSEINWLVSCERQYPLILLYKLSYTDKLNEFVIKYPELLTVIDIEKSTGDFNFEPIK